MALVTISSGNPIPNKDKLNILLQQLYDIVSEPYLLWMVKKPSKTIDELSNVLCNIITMIEYLNKNFMILFKNSIWVCKPDIDTFPKYIKYPRNSLTKEKINEKRENMKKLISEIKSLAPFFPK